MATRSTKGVDRDLTEDDRLQIGNARAVLQRFDLLPDLADMSDVAYEQRNCRMKAMDLAAAIWRDDPSSYTDDACLATADRFYDYIWKGRADAAV